MENTLQIHHRSDVDPADLDLENLIKLTKSWFAASKRTASRNQVDSGKSRLDYEVKIKDEVQRIFDQHGLFIDALDLQVVERDHSYEDIVVEIVDSERLLTYTWLDEEPSNITYTIFDL